jgi:squalene-hopene/tetraprenyl-beta-curcumene cyclase
MYVANVSIRQSLLRSFFMNCSPLLVRFRISPAKWIAVVAGLAMMAASTPVVAQKAAEAELRAAKARTIAAGQKYLVDRGQAADGSYSSQAGIGVTALVTTSLLRTGAKPTDAPVAKSLTYLEGFVQKDGGIYKSGSMFRNYETCLVVMCFKATGDKKYNEILAAADKFIRAGQIGTGDGVESGDAQYGGVGYGGNTRPDLSNTAFFVEALKSTGAAADDEAIQRALAFVSRCQNLETEHNTTPFAAKNPDGGFYYTPTGEGSSPAGKTANGGLRSYGAMSYAGLKSMIFAGLSKDDPRVKAALAWASKNYSVTENPGLGKAGLYYYLHLFSTAMDASGMDTIKDANGMEHDWRADLIKALASSQNKDGSWVNEDKKWLESDPNLVTGYALLTLAYCEPKANDKPAK